MANQPETPGNLGALLTAAIAGERAALEQLLYLHHDRLIAAIDRRLSQELRANLSPEDIAQEAYVVAFRKIGTFELRDENAFFSWLVRIAEHKLLDLAKARRAAKRGGQRQRVSIKSSESTSAGRTLIGILVVNERTPSRSIADRELASAVQRALAGLRDDYREALRLRYMEQLPVATIAEQLGRSEGAVHMLCHRGLKLLAKKMANSPALPSHLR